MPELRRDPVFGRWVIMDSKHSKGPLDFSKEDNTPTRQEICPFCPGREYQTPHEVDAVRPSNSPADTSGWMVRTVPNKFPVLNSDGNFQKEGMGIYDQMTGIGAHEVLIESPDHDKSLTELTKEEMKAVISQYQSRFRQLSKDSRFKYVVIFKNFGASAGATIEHTHSQIIALPMVPKTVLEELKGAEAYHQSHGRCVFCDMISQEYQDRERIVVENNSFLAFCPYAPRYAFETWIIPKGHNADFVHADDITQTHLAQILQDVLKRIKNVLGNPSYNYYLHTAPLGYVKWACYHWHIEIIPKLSRSVGFEWGAGLHIVPTFPQDAARYLREA
ncbi:MAG: galactose-1-phosphate uridylyltransferase [Candidatus Omnitrophica bacterium]|nr:galactose-1-phosphate uridylyltransferase [Candidatus Omnitrophota bacterium]